MSDELLFALFPEGGGGGGGRLTTLHLGGTRISGAAPLRRLSGLSVLTLRWEASGDESLQVGRRPVVHSLLVDGASLVGSPGAAAMLTVPALASMPSPGHTLRLFPHRLHPAARRGSRIHDGFRIHDEQILTRRTPEMCPCSVPGAWA